ncbi:MAG: NYN domain-containing protein [Patescibacteria group bacterium]|nr:NYN domain-containing protein [Patescibacteria group bacterium]
MLKHKSQRVGVFIDVQNMYYSARNIYDRRVDFGAVLEAAVAERQLIRALAYVVRATGEEHAFFEALYHRGLEIKERELQVFDSGHKKADWDVGIAVDAIRIGEILDVVVLVSGDGDFVELVEYLKHHGRKVEVLAFRQSCSSKLIAAADEFTDLSEDPDRYTIAARPRAARGAQPEPETPAEDESLTPQRGHWLKPVGNIEE